MSKATKSFVKAIENVSRIKDGKSFAKKINYQPSLFIKSKKDNTTFTTLQDL